MLAWAPLCEFGTVFRPLLEGLVGETAVKNAG